MSGERRRAKAEGADLGGRNISSRDKRIAQFGLANQMNYETEQRIQRSDMLERMAEGKRAAQRKHQKKVSQTTGMNAGVVGGINRRG